MLAEDFFERCVFLKGFQTKNTGAGFFCAEKDNYGSAQDVNALIAVQYSPTLI